MKKLFRFIRGYRIQAVLAPLLKMCEAVLELLVPLVVASIIDRGIAGSDTPYIIRMCLVLAALGVVGLGFSVTAQYFSARTATGFVRQMRSALFRHITSLSYSDTDRVGTSTLITRMTADSEQVQTGINLTLRLLLRSPFVVFGAMIMSFTVDPPSAWIFAVVIPLLSVFVFGIMLITMPLYTRVRQRLDKVTLRTKENLTGVRVLRAFCREDEEQRGFAEENAALTSIQNKVARISALLNPLTLVTVNLAIVFLIYRGTVRISSGSLTGGQLVAIYNYMSQILVELIKLANLIVSITKALACARRISAVLDISSEPSVGELDFPRDSSVELRSLSFRYSGAGDMSLRNISFHAPAGSTVGIIGGTGSGKSTLINLIPGFYPPTEGQVLIGGTDIRDIDRTRLRKSIGVVPQKAELFRGTVRDNMRWGAPDASDDDITRALAVAQADRVVADKGGLDALIEQGGRNLSGGQRQRLTIARALVGNPGILILDDSASALDYATDAALRAAISEIEGVTVFIVSQRASSVMSADQIIVLDDGEAVGIGTHSQLLECCPVYREIYDSQFGGDER